MRILPIVRTERYRTVDDCLGERALGVARGTGRPSFRGPVGGASSPATQVRVKRVLGYRGQYGSLIAISSDPDCCLCSPLKNPPYGGTLLRTWTTALVSILVSPPSTAFLTDQARRSAACSGSSLLSEPNSGGFPKSCAFSGSSACLSTSHHPAASRPKTPCSSKINSIFALLKSSAPLPSSSIKPTVRTMI